MEKEFLELQVDNYDKLCHRAKEIIWEALINDNKCFCEFLKDNGIILLKDSTPIEQILFWAITIVYNEYKFGFQFSYQQDIQCDKHSYKADFCILTVSPNADSNYFDLKHKVVIECDGFDFHSNKIQMAQDYKRENNIKLAGYDIIRFTGSQIYNTPLDCARTIYDYLETKIKNKEYIEEDINE